MPKGCHGSKEPASVRLQKQKARMFLIHFQGTKSTCATTKEKFAKAASLLLPGSSRANIDRLWNAAKAIPRVFPTSHEELEVLQHSIFVEQLRTFDKIVDIGSGSKAISKYF